MYQHVLSLSWNSKVVKMTKFFHEDMKKLELTYGPGEFNLKNLQKSKPYICPWSSKAVPFCPPMSQTIIDSSKLPENNSFDSASQASDLTLPKNKMDNDIE